MKTILVKGLTEKKEKTIECMKCECIFSYEEEDIKENRDRYNEYHNSIVCPWCKKELYIVGDKGF